MRTEYRKKNLQWSLMKEKYGSWEKFKRDCNFRSQGKKSFSQRKEVNTSNAIEKSWVYGVSQYVGN
jgi:hypothetical protein